MNDLIPARARRAARSLYHGEDLYAPDVDPVQVRKRIGMVFQKPNPFPKSIYDNIAFGPRVLGMKGDMDEIVERALRARGALGRGQGPPRRPTPSACPAASSSASASPAALAIEPDVILMDEPCSALDPISTGRIEDLMLELKQTYSIVIVTHNMQQAARVSDMTAFFIVELDADEDSRTGRLVEYDATEKIFTNPARHSAPRTTSPASSARWRRCPTQRSASTSSDELAQLEDQALGGWTSSIEQLDRALEAVEHQDVELAEFVIADDDRIDGRYLEVHQGILSLLALQAPVATDLRLVAALLHVIKHVERMGDQCVNIAKLIPLVGHEPPVDAEHARRRSCTMGTQARAGRRRRSRPSSSRRRARRATSSRQDERVEPPQPGGLPPRASRSATTTTRASGR